MKKTSLLAAALLTFGIALTPVYAADDMSTDETQPTMDNPADSQDSSGAPDQMNQDQMDSQDPSMQDPSDMQDNSADQPDDAAPSDAN